MSAGALLAELGRALAGASLVAAALGLAAAAVLRLLRRLPPDWKAWIWWLVAARAIVELAGLPGLSLAVLPASSPAAPAIARAAAAPPETIVLGAAPLDVSAVVGPVVGPGVAPVAAPVRAALDPWAVAGTLWLAGLAGAALLVARSAARWRALVGRARAARAADHPALAAAVERARETLGLRGPVDVRLSAEIASPVAVGLLAPVVLLPRDVAMSAEETGLVLLHELAHLRRRDRWRALVPALAARLFFFHPIVRGAAREFALAVEAACDAEVVARRTAPADRYGRLLVRFAAGTPATVAGAWPLAAPNVRRRLDMLVQGSLDRRRLALAVPLVLLAALAIAVPVRLVAAPAVASPPEVPAAPDAAPVAAPPAIPAPTSAPAQPASPAPRATPSPRAGAGSSSPRAWAVPPAPAVAAVPPAPRVAWPTPAPGAWPVPAAPPARAPLARGARLAPLPALPPLPPIPPALELSGYDWLVLVDADSRWTMSAPRWAVRRAEALAREGAGPVLLVGRGDESWLSRDSAAIDALHEVVEGQAEQAAEMARRVAREAERLGEANEALAFELERTAARAFDPDLTRLEHLAAAEADRLGRLAEELRAQGIDAAPELEARWRALADQMSALERELAEVGADLERRRAEDRLGGIQAGERWQRDQEAARAAFEADRRRFEREQADAARRAGEELGRRLDAMIGDGRLAPVEER